MGAIKNTSLIEGNLAADPQIFPKGQYSARVTFRILHTSRRLDQETGQWVDGRTAAVQVNFYGATAERYIGMIEQQPELFAKGTPVVAWGDVSDRPDAYVGKDGQPAAVNVVNGNRIVPDVIVQQRRAAGRNRQQQTAPIAGEDPWA